MEKLREILAFLGFNLNLQFCYFSLYQVAVTKYTEIKAFHHSSAINSTKIKTLLSENSRFTLLLKWLI